jgi:hypothetical protein
LGDAQTEEQIMNDMPKLEAFPTVAMPGWELGSDAAQQFCNRGQIVAQAMTDWNTEYSRFVTHRMSRASEAVAQIAKCHSLPEMITAQTKWFQEAVDDYMRQASKLMEVNSKIMGDLLPQIGQSETRQSAAKTSMKVGS